MKLPIALATLFLAATTALPAFARAPTGHSFYSHGGVAQYTRNGPAWRAEGAQHGYNAYAAAPRMSQPAANGWGHCVSGAASENYSAYPSWDVC
jgi:hypothetical protein